MFRSIAVCLFLFAGFMLASEVQAVPTCHRPALAAYTTEQTPTGTKFYPTTGPCHALALAPRQNVPFAGFMIIVAAGGWHSHPQVVRNFHNVYAQNFANDGFFTYTVEHTSGSGTALGANTGFTGFSNLVQHYDEVRAFANSIPGGSSYPICVYGISSGGNFSLMLGVARPALNCIIAEAAPTDVRTVSASMPAQVRQLAVDAFGVENLAVFSPIAWPAAEYIRQKVLLGHAFSDQFVGRAQSLDFCASRPGSTYCYILNTSNGTHRFTHETLVTLDSLLTYFALHHQFAP